MDTMSKKMPFKKQYMKFKNLVCLALLMIFISSCGSIRVFADYDPEVNFANYQSFAFFKPGIDEMKISELDKRRMMKSIEVVMQEKGFVLQENADILVSLSTREQNRVDIFQGNNLGWGWANPFGWYSRGFWGPPYWGNQTSVSSSVEGSLYIDILDRKSKQLIWQGKGTGMLNPRENPEERSQRIETFVRSILEKYPPES